MGWDAEEGITCGDPGGGVSINPGTLLRYFCLCPALNQNLRSCFGQVTNKNAAENRGTCLD